MKKSESEFSSGRRETMKKIALGSAAGLFGMLEGPFANAETAAVNNRYKAGLPPVKIRSVKAIATASKSRRFIND